MIRAGQLRHEVTLQAPTKAQDSYGGETVTWSTIDTIWAAIWPMSAREDFKGNQRQAEAIIPVRIRYRRDVRPEWRLVNGNQVLNITGIVNHDMRNNQLDLACVEAVT